MRLPQVKRFPGRGRPGHQQSPTRHRGCSLGILAGVAVLLLVAASCAPSGEAPQAALPTEIEDTGDLLAVLRGAGVSVQPTSALPTLGFGGRGQVVQIGEALAEVYEFGSVEDREKVSASIVAGAQAAGPLASAHSSTPSFWAAGRLIVAYTGSDGGTVLLLQALLGDPITLAEEVVDEPYPPAVLAVLADAAEQFDLPVASLSVIGLEETTWSDTCLDLPLPGETCLKGPLPGWRVQVRAGESEAWFRTDLAGEVVRLEEPAQVP